MEKMIDGSILTVWRDSFKKAAETFVAQATSLSYKRADTGRCSSSWRLEPREIW